MKATPAVMNHPPMTLSTPVILNTALSLLHALSASDEPMATMNVTYVVERGSFSDVPMATNGTGIYHWQDKNTGVASQLSLYNCIIYDNYDNTNRRVTDQVNSPEEGKKMNPSHNCYMNSSDLSSKFQESDGNFTGTKAQAFPFEDQTYESGDNFRFRNARLKNNFRLNEADGLTANGYPITDKKSDYDPANPYANRDPRLAKYIIYNGQKAGSGNTVINRRLSKWEEGWTKTYVSICTKHLSKHFK